MILVELPRDAAAELAESWGDGDLIALLGLAYCLNTWSRGCGKNELLSGRD